MKKLSSIYFSLIIFLVFLLFSCNNHQNEYKECFSNLSLIKIIQEVVKDSLESNFRKNDKVITMLFYADEKEQYMLLNTASGYSEAVLKASCYCNKVMFAYYGFDDLIAKKYLNLIERDKYIDYHLNDDNIDYAGYDPIFPPRYYKITKEEFIQITPDEINFQNLYNIMIDNGYLLLPPPPPIN